MIESCLIEGEDFLWNPPGTPGRTALRLTNQHAQICGSTVIQGGDGNQGPSLYAAGAGNGIALASGTLRVLDGQIRAGANGLGTISPGHTISASGTHDLRIAPRVVLTGPSGPQLGTDVMPQLTGTSAPTGGTLNASVTTESGDLVILVVGLAGPSIQVPGLTDPFWIDPLAHTFLAIRTQPTGTPVSGSVAVPAGGAFRGVQLAWGAACLGPLTGFQATNPSITAVY